jgi:hypothetical protein
MEQCGVSILRDFFRYCFDGSGCGDYFSAGWCVDVLMRDRHQHRTGMKKKERKRKERKKKKGWCFC